MNSATNLHGLFRANPKRAPPETNATPSMNSALELLGAAILGTERQLGLWTIEGMRPDTPPLA